jgi:diguanylate cyclase (GGDEF)-like protein
VVLRDPAGLAYAVTAVVCMAVAVFTWRCRAQNPTLSTTLTLVMVGGCWWSIGLAVTVASTDPTVSAIAMLSTFPGPSLMVAAFVCFGFAIARPQWVPRRALVVALLIEPVLIMLAGLTNPWHLLVYRGAGAAHLTGAAGWTYGPVFWLDTWYEYLEMAVGITLVAWSLWKAPAVYRAQRLALLVAALVPVGANAVFLAGAFGHTMDLTPFGFAVTGIMMFYAIFRRDLFTLSPVARALIVDQIGDAVVVISPGGRVLDLNPAAVDLLRGMNPDAPTMLVGVSAAELFPEGLSTTGGHHTEIVVELLGGRAEFQVRAFPLIDRRHLDLGNVFVARDVTEANNQSRRLAAAHAQLVGQVETIGLLRADLVELASRDPLTGLHNRRHMIECFASMITSAKDSGQTLAAVMFDVDRFKAINDAFGHLAGDAVLIALAQLMQEQAPAGALVARWGGEEFFVALPGASAGQGLVFAEDLRRRWAQHPTAVEGQMIHCTFSAGVATYPVSGTTMEDLFHAADESMYEAKNDGRNLVRLHRDPVPSQRSTPATRE